MLLADTVVAIFVSWPGSLNYSFFTNCSLAEDNSWSLKYALLVIHISVLRDGDKSQHIHKMYGYC